MSDENISYVLVTSKSLLVSKILQAIPFWAFWFLIGWLIGTFFNRFVARVALWLGVVVLITILLSSLGIVDVNTSNISDFFKAFSNWFLKIGKSIRSSSFIKIDGATVIFFILGVGLSAYQARKDNVSRAEVETETEAIE